MASRWRSKNSSHAKTIFSPSAKSTRTTRAVSPLYSVCCMHLHIDRSLTETGRYEICSRGACTAPSVWDLFIDTKIQPSSGLLVEVPEFPPLDADPAWLVLLAEFARSFCFGCGGDVASSGMTRSDSSQRLSLGQQLLKEDAARSSRSSSGSSSRSSGRWDVAHLDVPQRSPDPPKRSSPWSVPDPARRVSSYARSSPWSSPRSAGASYDRHLDRINE